MSFPKASIGVDIADEGMVMLMPEIKRNDRMQKTVSAEDLPRTIYLQNLSEDDGKFICDAVNEKLEREFTNGGGS